MNHEIHDAIENNAPLGRFVAEVLEYHFGHRDPNLMDDETLEIITHAHERDYSVKQASMALSAEAG